jgi:hypothetical protein
MLPVNYQCTVHYVFMMQPLPVLDSCAPVDESFTRGIVGGSVQHIHHRSTQPHTQHACGVLMPPRSPQDLADAVAALRGMPGPSATLILTTACYSSIAAQLKLLAQTRLFKSGACLLAAVITSVATSSFYEDDSCCECLPGTLEQASPGLVDLIVLSGTKHASRVSHGVM